MFDHDTILSKKNSLLLKTAKLESVFFRYYTPYLHVKSDFLDTVTARRGIATPPAHDEVHQMNLVNV